MARKIAQRPYSPKPTDAGQTVEVNGRVFTIWSAGPLPASLWAVDSDGRWAVLKTRNGVVSHVQQDFGDRNPNARLRLAEAVRTGRPYYSFEEVRYGAFVGQTSRYATLHLDPECRAATDDRKDADPATRREVARCILFEGHVGGCPCVVGREPVRRSA